MTGASFLLILLALCAAAAGVTVALISHEHQPTDPRPLRVLVYLLFGVALYLCIQAGRQWS